MNIDPATPDKYLRAAAATERTHEIVNNGISQAFDYGIGMTVLTLFLLAALALCVWLLRFFLKYVKDSIKQAADNYALANALKVQLEAIYAQYNQLIILLSEIKNLLNDLKK